MFMTVEICEKIMLTKPLSKGCGLHLDPLILAFTNLTCGIFGLPWVSVATLKALAHISALTVFSKNNPPGMLPTVVKVRENRVSACVMSIMIGLSIFMAPVLKRIPMPVLFGVFLYMGMKKFDHVAGQQRNCFYAFNKVLQVSSQPSCMIEFYSS